MFFLGLSKDEALSLLQKVFTEVMPFTCTPSNLDKLNFWDFELQPMNCDL